MNLYGVLFALMECKVVQEHRLGLAEGVKSIRSMVDDPKIK